MVCASLHIKCLLSHSGISARPFTASVDGDDFDMRHDVFLLLDGGAD